MPPLQPAAPREKTFTIFIDRSNIPSPICRYEQDESAVAHDWKDADRDYCAIAS